MAKPPAPAPALTEVMNASGRVPLAFLVALAEGRDEASFAEHIGCPVLAGWALREGILASGPSGRRKTLAFKPAELFARMRATVTSRPSESLQEAVYPLKKGPLSASADPTVFTIGRQAGNDLVIPDLALSAQHARIDVAGGEHYLRDLGSRNGTAVNGRTIEGAVKLSSRDTVSFARYEFTFASPEMLHRLLLQRALEAADGKGARS